MLAVGPKVDGSNLAESNGFLRAIEIRGTTSFREEVQPSAPCRKILWHVKKRYKHERDHHYYQFPLLSGT
jgi:hypothetical protein